MVFVVFLDHEILWLLPIRFGVFKTKECFFFFFCFNHKLSIKHFFMIKCCYDWCEGYVWMFSMTDWCCSSSCTGVLLHRFWRWKWLSEWILLNFMFFLGQLFENFPITNFRETIGNCAHMVVLINGLDAGVGKTGGLPPELGGSRRHRFPDLRGIYFPAVFISYL